MTFLFKQRKHVDIYVHQINNLQSGRCLQQNQSYFSRYKMPSPGKVAISRRHFKIIVFITSQTVITLYMHATFVSLQQYNRKMKMFFTKNDDELLSEDFEVDPTMP